MLALRAEHIAGYERPSGWEASVSEPDAAQDELRLLKYMATNAMIV
jgi:hypothetical protein